MSAPFVGPLRVDRLTDPPRLGLFGAYAQSKLALAVLGEAVAADFARDGILVRTADPGPNRTTMPATSDGMPWLLQQLVPLVFAAPERGGARLYDALLGPEFDDRTGVYIEKGRVTRLPKHAADAETRRRLTALLDELAARSPPGGRRPAVAARRSPPGGCGGFLHARWRAGRTPDDGRPAHQHNSTRASTWPSI